jgi:hypothetical protein
MGQRTFSLLSIRRQDLAGFVKVRTARFKAQIELAKLDLRKESEKRMQEALELERLRFKRETTEMFLKWTEDQRAQDIASSQVSHGEKIEKLGELMFGEDWK